jgi:gamma-D-glutamyl-L-lysine dipeptidyl-peptidase
VRNIRILCIFISLILIQTVTGCSSIRRIPVSNNQELNISSGHITFDKNSGVVIDTVADVYERPDIQSIRITQVIYNQPVYILSENENWIKIKAVDGFIGWIKSRAIDKDYTSIKSGNFKYKIVITAKEKSVCESPFTGINLINVVMGTELYCTAKNGDWYGVALPLKKIGWVSSNGVIQVASDSKIPKTSSTDFVVTAEKFNGTQYLEGGISCWEGIDCSGLIYICSKINGVDLPRDALKQYTKGITVIKTKGSMLPGDLLFFSGYGNLDGISQVGIFVGDGQFIYADRSKGSVMTGSMDDMYFAQKLVGIRRVF